MQMILSVAVGGALGAAARYLVNVATTRLFGIDFPWGTVAVNVTGSFLMGALISFMALKWSTGQEMRAFLTTGVLGGFTTLSALSLDFATLFERGQSVLAAAYVVGSVAVSLIAIFAGLSLVRLLMT